MDTIGKYKLVRVIGEGGMGRVYEAIDPIIGRRVAIKTISLNVGTDADVRLRFFREAQAAGRLSHPNLITIYDVGDADGTPYIVMEFLEGTDLSRKIRDERLSYETKMAIMIDVCEGLAFAHCHDIIHRDIKPANIFVTTNGRVKILDFGLARGALSDITQTGRILGTPNYMAPEQIRGDDVDHRADIFAAGVVFYELLIGRKAFEGDSIATTLYKVLETQPPPVHLVDQQLPATLSAVIDRALAKDRLARFQTSRDMLDALVHAHGRTTQLERADLQTTPVPTPNRATPASVRRNTTTTVAWAVAGVIVAGTAGFALWSQYTHNRRPAQIATQSEPDLRPTTRAQPSLPEAVRPSAPATSMPSPPGSNRLAKTTAANAAEGTPAAPVSPPVDVRPSAPPPEANVAAAPAAPAVVPPAPPESRPAPPQSPPVVAPMVSSPPPLQAATPTARTDENPAAAVQEVLARYRAALESRDISALKRIWPSLSGRQEDAIRNEFEHSRAIVVSLGTADIRPTGSGATVTCRRSYAVTTADGQTLRTTTTMVMTLARRDNTWSIEEIRHEVAR